MVWFFRKNNVKVSDDGRHARLTGKGTGPRTSVAMPVKSKANNIDSVQIPIIKLTVSEIEAKHEQISIQKDRLKASYKKEVAPFIVTTDEYRKTFDSIPELVKFGKAYKQALENHDRDGNDTSHSLLIRAYNELVEAKKNHPGMAEINEKNAKEAEINSAYIEKRNKLDNEAFDLLQGKFS